MAFRLRISNYKSKSPSCHAKYRQYYTVVKPVCLYKAETLAKMKTADREKRKKFLEKILQPRKLPLDGYKCQLISTQEIYDKFDVISVSMRNRRLMFCGCIKRLGMKSLSNQILNLADKWKTQLLWLQEEHEDMKRYANITLANVQDRTSLKNKIECPKGLSSGGLRFSAEERLRKNKRLKNETAKRKYLEEDPKCCRVSVSHRRISQK